MRFTLLATLFLSAGGAVVLAAQGRAPAQNPPETDLVAAGVGGTAVAEPVARPAAADAKESETKQGESKQGESKQGDAKQDDHSKKDDAKDAKKSDKAPVNKFCPIERENEIDPKVTYTYKGKVIGFCCAECIGTFKKDPEKYMKDLK